MRIFKTSVMGLIIVIGLILFSTPLFAEYRVDIFYSNNSIWVDEFWDRGEYYEFRAGRLFFTLDKKQVKAIIVDQRPRAPASYVTKEEYDRQVREAEESRRRWEMEESNRRHEENLRRIIEEARREREWAMWLNYRPRVIYIPHHHYVRPYHRYPRYPHGIHVGGSGKGWWFNLNVPLYQQYYYEERVIVK